MSNGEVREYVQAERALLGAMMIETWAAHRGLQMLVPRDFYDPKHGAIFTAMELIHEDGSNAVDITTVETKLIQMKRGDIRREDLLKCVDAVVTAANLEYYIKLVLDSSIERRIDHKLSEVNLERTPENSKELGDLILALQGNRGVSIFDMRKDLGPMIDSIIEKPEPGLTSGFKAWDGTVGPAHRGDLVTISARPGGGKTALMTKIAASYAEEFAGFNAELPAGQRPRSALYLTTEMTVKQMVQRLLPMATGVPLSLFRSASFGPHHVKRIVDVAPDLATLPLLIYGKPRLSLDDIRGAVFQAKPSVVFIDYLQRCRMPRAENMAYAIAEFYAELKSFLLEVGVVGYIGAQTDREVDKNPLFAPTMAHLKGSGGIESESDVVAMLWEPPEQVIAKRVDWVPPRPDCVAMELIVRKNRNGDKDVVADLELEGRYVKMCERLPDPTKENLA